MFNTFKNLSRKSEKYGDVHFISFLGATLSRLAYLNDNKFLTSYNIQFDLKNGEVDGPLAKFFSQF